MQITLTTSCISHVQFRIHPDNPFPVYIPSHDSRHFDSPVPLNVVSSKTLLALRGTGVWTCGSSMGVDGQPTVGVFPIPFPTSPALDDTHRACCPTSVTYSLDSKRRYGDIRARAETGSGEFRQLEIASSRQKHGRQREKYERRQHFQSMDSACASQIRQRSEQGGGDTPGRAYK